MWFISKVFELPCYVHLNVVCSSTLGKEYFFMCLQNFVIQPWSLKALDKLFMPAFSQEHIIFWFVHFMNDRRLNYVYIIFQGIYFLCCTFWRPLKSFLYKSSTIKARVCVILCFEIMHFLFLYQGKNILILRALIW